MTPHPWTAEGFSLRGKGGRFIADFGPRCLEDYPESCTREDYANAQLCSAAPAMLEALEMFMSAVNTDDLDEVIAHTINADALARKAIAKAKGIK